MNKRIYIIALVTALICGGIIFYVFRLQNKSNAQTLLEAEQIKAEEDAAKTEVVVAACNIPKGAEIDAGMLKTFKVERNILITLPTANTVSESVIGAQALTNINQDTIICDEMVRKRGMSALAENSIAYEIPDGFYAVEIPVEDRYAVAERLEKGDYVDVLYKENTVNEEKTENEKPDIEKWDVLVQNVPVIAIGDRTYREESGELYSFIVVAGTMETVLTIINAQVTGEVRLILPAYDPDRTLQR